MARTSFLRSPKAPAVLIGSILILLLRLPRPGLAAVTTQECLAQFSLANHACAFLSPTPPGEQHRPSRRGEHGQHGRGRGHHHVHHGAGHLRRHKECCRWLHVVDKACVCDVLALRLPLALVKPKHQYSLEVMENCTVVFECGGV
ncbi:hypothetical protein Cni_G15496 [Canna indica]|uniref:Uncharacterized protein n=1 Tax=Canna indica TaxID=4628 RepID=A0AAQ3KDX8_9LILI|nr:hypothetical protein Cni_G15496 [Canna indica]